jgi:hypothetical protein
MTKSIDVNMRAADWTESSGETRREVMGARLIAGVSVPDSPLIAEALEYARKLSEPYLFNHAVRSWLFAVKIGHLKRIDYDPEVVAVGTILHDIGLTAGVSGPNRFEVNGAAAAVSFTKERGLSNHRVQLIWDLFVKSLSAERLSNVASITNHGGREHNCGLSVSDFAGAGRPRSCVG